MKYQSFNPFRKDINSYRRGDMILVGFAVCLLAVITWVSPEPHNNDKVFANLNDKVYRTAEQLVQTAASLAAERGLIYSAMYNDAPVSADTRNRIQAYRADADTNYKAVMDFFRSENMAQLSRPHSLDNQTLIKLNDIRQEIDLELGIGRPDRDMYLANDWFYLTARSIESVDRVFGALNKKFSSLDPALRDILKLQRSALTLREQVSRERAFLSSAAEGATLSLTQQAELQVYPDTEKRFSDILTIAAKRLATDPELSRAILNAQNVLLYDYAEIRSEMIDSYGDSFPMTAAAWFDQATRAVDSLNQLATAVVNHVQKTLAEKQANRTRLT